MGIITKIEEKIEGIIERPFRVNDEFDLPGIEIELKRIFEKKKKNILGRMLVPNNISILIDQPIYEKNASFLEDMEASLKTSLHVWQKENEYETLSEIEVSFRQGCLDGCSSSIYAYFKEVEKKNSAARGEVTRRQLGLLKNIKTGETYDIYEEGCSLGRAEECTIRIQDSTVSRQHAEIICVNGKCILRDLGSRAGTRLNLKRVKESRLSDGDKVSIGSTTLVFSIVKK